MPRTSLDYYELYCFVLNIFNEILLMTKYLTVEDYQMLCGERIQYRKLGFGTLYEFLSAVNGVSIQNLGSVVKVVATPNEKTGHILKLISGQRNAPKKSKRIRSVSLRSLINYKNQFYLIRVNLSFN